MGQTQPRRIGRGSAPRRGHVVVVGLGRVAIRLRVELRKVGVPVVGVERVGLRPLADDGLPLVGGPAHQPQVLIATGFRPVGPTIGPYVGRSLADAILEVAEGGELALELRHGHGSTAEVPVVDVIGRLVA